MKLNKNVRCTIYLIYFFRNEPLSSLKFLVIAKELLIHNLLNEQFKKIICNILKQPYWIHLYSELYHQLYDKLFNVSISLF